MSDARLPARAMTNRLSKMCRELDDWVVYYQARDHDQWGMARYGKYSERAAILQDVARALESAADTLYRLPRLS